LPYSGPEDPKLPDDVKKASAKKRRAFAAAFNSAMAQHQGDEGKAMAIAHAAMKGVRESIYAVLGESESITQRVRAVEDAVSKRFPRQENVYPSGAWCEDVLDDAVILRIANRTGLHRLHYTISAKGEVILADEEPKLVRATYESAGLCVYSDQSVAPSPTAALLSESGDLSGIELEEAEGGDRLRNVVLLAPGWSKNGRYYSREVVARSVAHWEGTRAFLDHPSKSDERDRPERSVRDLAGYYEGARVDQDGRAVADLRLLGMHAPHVSALAREAKRAGRDLVGVSINAVGRMAEGEAEGRKGQIVEDITRGFSADIVTTPAAGGGFQAIRASTSEETAALLAAASYEQWREASPAHLERLRREMQSERQTDAVKRRDAEITALKEAQMSEESEVQTLREQLATRDQRITALEAQATARESVERGDRLLRELALPEVWHDAVRPLLAGKAEDEQKAVIEGELGKLRALRDKGMLKAEVKGGGQGAPDDGRKAEAVTREAAAMLGVKVTLLPLKDEDAYAYKRRLAEASNKSE